jgi:hypothetical protein
MLRVVRPEAGECRISLEMWQEKNHVLLQTAALRPNPSGFCAVRRVFDHEYQKDSSDNSRYRVIPFFQTCPWGIKKNQNGSCSDSRRARIRAISQNHAQKLS